MIKKTITYTDYNGVERTEDFYFNISKAEVAEQEMAVAGGYTNVIQAMIQAQDVPGLSKVFTDFIRKSYGVKSLDGRRFEKSEQLSTEFIQTEAYSVLLLELLTNTEEAIKFVNGVMPQSA